jgi:hypothetical protein
MLVIVSRSFKKGKKIRGARDASASGAPVVVIVGWSWCTRSTGIRAMEVATEEKLAGNLKHRELEALHFNYGGR